MHSSQSRIPCELALVRAGGDIDAVCEGCHLAFWYPNQVIPAFPSADDPHRPIFRAGTLTH